MKWLTTAAIALALLIVCAYVMVNKQEEVIHLTDSVQKYMGRRDALKKEVDELEDRRDKFDAMRNEWIEHRKRAGELSSLYGDKEELENACKTLTKRRGKLRSEIVGYTNEVAMLERRIGELEIQTNALLCVGRKAAEERDMYFEMRKEASAEYDKQKARTVDETKRADEAAARAAKELKRYEEYLAKVEVISADVDAKVKVYKKREVDAREAADAESKKLAKLNGEVTSAQAKAAALAAEVTALEAKQRELVGTEKALKKKNAELAEVESKIATANEKVTAQQIANQIDAVRESVSQKLGKFESKLKELEKSND